MIYAEAFNLVVADVLTSFVDGSMGSMPLALITLSQSLHNGEQRLRIFLEFLDDPAIHSIVPGIYQDCTSRTSSSWDDVKQDIWRMPRIGLLACDPSVQAWDWDEHGEQFDGKLGWRDWKLVVKLADGCCFEDDDSCCFRCRRWDEMRR